MTVYVEPIPNTPARHGLLEAASVLTVSGHALMGVQFEPNCGMAHLTVGACVAGGPGADSRENPAPSKIVDTGIGVIEGEPFAVYHLFGCKAPGSYDRGVARARQSFDLAEQRAVEEWFAEYLTTHPDAVDITPAGIVSVLDGLAELERYAGEHYGGVPVIHMDRRIATLLASTSVLGVVNGRLETALGSRVAAGSGYGATFLGDIESPAGLGDPESGAAPISDSDGWMYVTGAVGVWRGDVLVTDPPIMEQRNPGPLVAAAAQPPGRGYTNEFRVLVERPYIAATECIVAAIKVTAKQDTSGGLS